MTHIAAAQTCLHRIDGWLGHTAAVLSGLV
jgi:hypothetical protein